MPVPNSRATESRSFLSLVQECSGAVIFGAALGAVSFAVLAFQRFERTGAVVGALVGGVVGGFSGLDSALPAPSRRAGEGPVMGPFRAGASFVFAALACVVFSFYISGDITLECTRGDGGVRCSRVVKGWFNSTETGRVDYGPIATAYEGGTDQIVVALPDQQRQVIDGFDVAAVGALQTFLKSSDPLLILKSDVLAFAQPTFWAVAFAVGALGVFSFRSGIKQLRKVLAE